VAVVNNLLYVSGGKTDQFGSFSYTSAPTTNDLFTLDLSSSFDPSSPSWNYVSGSQNSSTTQGQELAWHSLAAYNQSQLLLFGGDGGPNSPIVLPSQKNSAILLDISSLSDPQWISESEGWASQPSRRIHQTTASNGGKVYLVGGEKDDGSTSGYSDHYVFDPSVPGFSQLPSDNGPSDIYGHCSTILSNGKMVVLGGYSASEAKMISFSTIWSLDTTSSSFSWSTESVSSSSVPPGRRAFACTWLEGDKVLIHGGSDASFQSTYNDGWVLDASKNPMEWSSVSALSQLGARRDHSAVQVGSQVLFFFGSYRL
jgi:N-acetylneuraminic acid mutarotase